MAKKKSKRVKLTDVNLPVDIPRYLSGKAFDDALAEAVKEVRSYMRETHQLLEISENNGVTEFKVLGGAAVWTIDRENKKINFVGRETKYVVQNMFMNSGSYRQELHKLVTLKIVNKLSKYGDLLDDTNIQSVVDSVGDTEEKLTYSVISREMNRQTLLIKARGHLVLHTCWGKNTPYMKALRTCCKKFWEHLDKEIARYAIFATGQSLQTSGYNYVWRNIDAFRETAPHSAALFPMWMKILIGNPSLKPTDMVEICKNRLAGNPTSAYEYDSLPKDRLTPRAWRYLLKLNPMWVRYLLTTGYTISPSRNEEVGMMSLSDILDFYAEVGEKPKFTTFLRMSRDLVGKKRSTSLVGFVRAAFKGSQKKPAKTFYAGVTRAWDWFKADYEEVDNPYVDLFEENRPYEVKVLDKNQMKQPWDWFVRQEQEWHRRDREVRQQRSVMPDCRWESLVPEFEHNGYTIVPLNDSVLLRKEGEAMHHCVGSYSLSCAKGKTRIFGIRKGKKHVSTLELGLTVVESAYDIDSPAEYTWKQRQHSGPTNSEISSEIKKLGNIIVNRYQKATEDIPETARKAKLFKKPIKMEDQLDMKRDAIAINDVHIVVPQIPEIAWYF